MDNSIVISTPPHVKSRRTTRNIMLDVLIALAPAAICGIVYFLTDALILEITCVAFAVIAEFVYFFIAKGGFNMHFNDGESRQLAKKVAQLKQAGQPYGVFALAAPQLQHDGVVVVEEIASPASAQRESDPLAHLAGRHLEHMRVSLQVGEFGQFVFAHIL